MTTEEHLNYMYDTILEYGIATREELELVTNINGYNKQALDDIVWARTGYQSLHQILVMELEQA